MNTIQEQLTINKDDESELRRDKQIKQRYRYAWLSIAAIIIALLYFAYLIFWPFRVTELDNIVVSTDPVKAGEYQRYSAEKCENAGSTARIERSVVVAGTDEAPVSLSDIPERAVQCSNIILVPESLPNGRYEILFHMTYKVNPLRDILNPIERNYRSMPFLVSEGRNVEIPQINSAPSQQPDNENEDVRRREGADEPTQGINTQPNNTDAVTRSETKPEPQTEDEDQDPNLLDASLDIDVPGIIEPIEDLLDIQTDDGSGIINTTHIAEGGLDDGQGTSTNDHTEASTPKQLRQRACRW